MVYDIVCSGALTGEQIKIVKAPDAEGLVLAEVNVFAAIEADQLALRSPTQSTEYVGASFPAS